MAEDVVSVQCSHPPRVQLTYLLGLPTALSDAVPTGNYFKVVRQIKTLQQRKGVERVRIHLPVQGPPGAFAVRSPPVQKRGKGAGKGFGKSRYPPKPSHNRLEPLHKNCDLHRCFWFPPDVRVYVELQTWSAACAASAIRDVARLVKPFGSIERVWFVLRSGAAAWLRKFPVESLLPLSQPRATPKQLEGLVGGLEQLPLSSGLSLVECQWWSAQLDESVSRLTEVAATVESIVKSLVMVSVAKNGTFLDPVDVMVATKWHHQSQSVLESLESTYDIIIVLSSDRPSRQAGGWLDRDLRLAVVGRELEVVRQAADRLSNAHVYGNSVSCLSQDLRGSQDVQIMDLIPSYQSNKFWWFLSLQGLQVMQDWGIDIVIWREHDTYCSETCRTNFSVHRIALDSLSLMEARTTIKMCWPSVLDWVDDEDDDDTFASALSWQVAKGRGRGSTQHLQDCRDVRECLKQELVVLLILDDGFDSFFALGRPFCLRALHASMDRIRCLAERAEVLEGDVDDLQRRLLHLKSREEGSDVEQLRADYDLLEEKVEDLARKLDAQCAKKDICETDLRELQGLMEASWSLAPFGRQLAKFLKHIPQLQLSDMPILVPVQALRFTHHTINADFAFGDDHENHQESIFKLFLNFFWGRLDPEHFEEPLHVFRHIGPDGKCGLFSRNNRRLIALSMLQAVRRDCLIQVPCLIYEDDDVRLAPVESRKSLARWFQEGYDSQDAVEGCNGLGLSIWPRAQRASHRGYPLLNPAQTALRALNRANERSPSQPSMRPEVLQALDVLCSAARARVVQGDEETLTFVSEADVGAGPEERTLAPKARGRGHNRAKGKGKGKSKSKT